MSVYFYEESRETCASCALCADRKKFHTTISPGQTTTRKRMLPALLGPRDGFVALRKRHQSVEPQRTHRMDHLINLAREFDVRRISIETFRERAIDALTTMNADELMSVAMFFADAEADGDIYDIPTLTKS